MDSSAATSASGQARPFLGVHFIKCRVYGRLYPDAERMAYVGFCPRCGAPLRVAIGEHGTKQRFFVAVCPGS